MANLLDAGLLLGIDLVALGLAATEMAVGSPGRVPAVALLADDAVAVQDVATTGLVAGLAQVLGDSVLVFVHPIQYYYTPYQYNRDSALGDSLQQQLIEHRTQVEMDQNIDLSKIQAIPHHEMLAISNQYMIGCVDHINKVADFAQKQMMDIDSLIDNLDNQVLILEKKLGIGEMAKAEGQ